MKNMRNIFKYIKNTSFFGFSTVNKIPLNFDKELQISPQANLLRFRKNKEFPCIF